jgi:DNA-binding transcriptional regulator YhcF (GntR family)
VEGLETLTGPMPVRNVIGRRQTSDVRRHRRSVSGQSRVERAKGELMLLVTQLAGEGGEARLPSEADLSTSLGVSRATLRSALGELATAGIVVRRHGLGTFVAPRPPLERGLESLSDISEQLRADFTTMRIDLVLASEIRDLPYREELGVQEPDEVLRMEREYTRADGVVAGANIFIPKRAGGVQEAALAESIRQGQRMGLPELLSALGGTPHVSKSRIYQVQNPCRLALEEVILTRNYIPIASARTVFAENIHLPITRHTVGDLSQLKVW